MNSMQTAMQSAGIQIPPLLKRIWLWLKDNPNKTARQVAIALREPLPRVQSRLSELKTRKMVETPNTASDHRGGRSLLCFVVTQKEFEMLPLPIKVKPAPITKLNPPLSATGFYPESFAAGQLSPGSIVKVPKTDTATKRVIHLDEMTIGEARVLYEQLHELFGGKS